MTGRVELIEPLATLCPTQRVYGLDIETDTELGGLDPRSAPIVAIALAGEGWSRVFTGAEDQQLLDLDEALRELPAGIVVTWNGARFDLPFLADRASLHGLTLGLRLVADRRTRTSREPLPGHDGGYHASWFGHAHLDAYAVYRSDVGAALGLPCGLKPLARLLGITPVEVDRTAIHELSDERLAEYVASDAVLARELALRRWPTASRAVDSVAAAST